MLTAQIAHIEGQLEDPRVESDEMWRISASKALRMKKAGLMMVQRRRGMIRRESEGIARNLKENFPDIYEQCRK